MKWRKARKKPIIIEFREPEPNDVICCGIYTDLHSIPIERIKTLEGDLIAYPDVHFIIKGTKGELYPIRKDIFYETYEVIEDE